MGWLRFRVGDHPHSTAPGPSKGGSCAGPPRVEAGVSGTQSLTNRSHCVNFEYLCVKQSCQGEEPKFRKHFQGAGLTEQGIHVSGTSGSREQGGLHVLDSGSFRDWLVPSLAFLIFLLLLYTHPEHRDLPQKACPCHYQHIQVSVALIKLGNSS